MTVETRELRGCFAKVIHCTIDVRLVGISTKELCISAKEPCLYRQKSPVYLAKSLV